MTIVFINITDYTCFETRMREIFFNKIFKKVVRSVIHNNGGKKTIF